MVANDKSASEQPKAEMENPDPTQKLSPEEQLALQKRFIKEYFQEPTSQLFKDITKASLIENPDDLVTKMLEIRKTHGYDALDMEEIYQAINSRDENPQEPDPPGPKPEDPKTPQLPPETQPISPNTLTPFNFEIYAGEYTYRVLPEQPLVGAYPTIQIESDGQITMPNKTKYKAINETDKDGRYWACWTVAENKEWYKIEFLRRWSEARKTKIKGFQGFHCTRCDGLPEVTSVGILGDCIDVDPVEKSKDKADADRKSDWWKSSLAMGGILTLYFALKYAKKKWEARNQPGPAPEPPQPPQPGPGPGPGPDPAPGPQPGPDPGPNPEPDADPEMERLREELREAHEKNQKYANDLNHFEEIRAGQEIMDMTDVVERNTLKADMEHAMEVEYNHAKEKYGEIPDLKSPEGKDLLKKCQEAGEGAMETWSKTVSDSRMANLDVQKRLVEGGSLPSGEAQASKKRVQQNAFLEIKGTIFGPGAVSKSLGMGFIEMKVLSEQYAKATADYLVSSDAYMKKNLELENTMKLVLDITDKRYKLSVELTDKGKEMQREGITELEKKALQDAQKDIQAEIDKLGDQYKTEKAKKDTLAIERDIADQKQKDLKKERDLKELEHKKLQEKREKQAKELGEHRFKRY